jgi:hypothetical protein
MCFAVKLTLFAGGAAVNRGSHLPEVEHMANKVSVGEGVKEAFLIIENQCSHS